MGKSLCGQKTQSKCKNMQGIVKNTTGRLLARFYLIWVKSSGVRWNFLSRHPHSDLHFDLICTFQILTAGDHDQVLLLPAEKLLKCSAATSTALFFLCRKLSLFVAVSHPFCNARLFHPTPHTDTIHNVIPNNSHLLRYHQWLSHWICLVSFAASRN